MAFDLRSASVLVACARAGSIGRAAQRLNMTQPAVSRMLARLEADLGVALFARTTRGLAPTVYGTALLPHAELILTEAERARALMAQMRGAQRGAVRIGGVGAVIGTVLVPAAAELRRREPEVEVRIVEELEDTLLDDLKRGEIDLALSPSIYTEAGVTLALTETHGDRVAVFARADHPLAKVADLRALAAAQWVLPPARTPIVQELRRRFLAAGLTPPAARVVSRSVHAIREATMADALLCWMPTPLVADLVAGGRLVEVPAPGLDWHRTFRLWRRDERVQAPVVTALIRIIGAMGRPSATP